jgi:hypothetical protein
MISLCHLKIGKLDFFFTGMTLDAQKIVVIDMLVVHALEMTEARNKP